MQAQFDRKIRDRLVLHIKGGEAFAPIDTLIDQISFTQTGIVPDGLPYSFYQQVYHIRFAQYDILEYCRNEEYKVPGWPDDYWPNQPVPEDEREWEELVKKYLDERNEFCNLILDPSNDLLEPFASDLGHNLLREAQLVIEHTSYHTGQLHIIYRLLNK
ncbi:MAG: DinB family protein [Balneolaceae bacterium]